MSAISAAGARSAAPVSTPANDTPLEPKKDLPTIAPYKPSVGGWIGTGAGALGGAALGGSIGMLAIGGLSLMAGIRGGTQLGMFAGLGIGGVAGGLIGGMSVHSMNKNSYLDNAHAQQDKEFGTSTLAFARENVAKFDHNTDGAIQLDNATGLSSKDERVATEFNEFKQARNVSASNIWHAADTNPADRKVTDTELATLMSQFDVDKSGSLTTPEQDAFFAAHPVQTDSWAAPQ